MQRCCHPSKRWTPMPYDLVHHDDDQSNQQGGSTRQLPVHGSMINSRRKATESTPAPMQSSI